jgi:predicted esterase
VRGAGGQGLSWAVVLFLLVLAVPASAVPAPGWARVEVPATGSYFTRYVPHSLDPSRPAPVVLFLHGSGAHPQQYWAFLTDAAERARCVLVLPRSSSPLGWGFGEDDRTIAESLRRIREDLPVDPSRISAAGHSAGGAYAYRLAYTTRSGFSAVFTAAAPRYTVSAVADPAYKAPIRMFYGTGDPNYSNGSYAGLKQQWERLGIPWEEDVREGYGHGSLPPEAMEQGLLFLVSRRYPGAGACVPAADRLCLRDGRFQVEVDWRDFHGTPGRGKVAPAVSADSGLFWFFGADNWEVLVKVLDGCGYNGHFWVYAAATTSVEYTLTVTDTRLDRTVRYRHPAGTPAPAITDSGALPCF